MCSPIHPAIGLFGLSVIMLGKKLASQNKRETRNNKKNFLEQELRSYPFSEKLPNIITASTFTTESRKDFFGESLFLSSVSRNRNPGIVSRGVKTRDSIWTWK